MDGYLDFVIRKAKEMNKTFILDTGEGRDCKDPFNDWYIEDLSGWLVEDELVQELLNARQHNNEYIMFNDFYVL